MKTLKRMISSILVFALLLCCLPTALADEEKSRAVIGADLTEEQITSV